MKSFIQTLKNIYKIEELRSRILFTLMIILIYRLGSRLSAQVLIPPRLSLFRAYFPGSSRFARYVLGGAFSKASIFALGIMPYISASIIIQLLTIAVPYFQRMQKEGRERPQEDEPDHTVPYSCGTHTASPGLSYTDSAPGQGNGSVPIPGFFHYYSHGRYHICDVAWRTDNRQGYR